MASSPFTRLTEEEYLRLERAAEIKSEFHDGQMYAMSGGSPTQALLGGSICAILHRQVPLGCRVYNSDLRLHLAAAKTYTYPDCSVVCGPLKLSSDQKDNLINPTLIVEILSPSTEDYDRGKKFELYRTIQSFEEYLVIHQDRSHVEHYSRQEDESWILREFAGDGAVVMIHRLGIQIPLADLYAGAFAD